MKNLIYIFIVSLIPLTSWGANCDGATKQFPTTDPQTNQPWVVKAREFIPPTNSKVATVFILPPIDGANELDRTLAIAICASGMRAYIVNVINDPEEVDRIWDLNTHTYEVERVEKGLKLVMDKLETDSGVSGKFGIMGASLGAIQSAYIAGSEPRILASVLLAGGGNVPGILAYSEQETIKKLRLGRLSLYGIPDQASYEAVMKPFIIYDPIDVAGNVKPDSMFMFITTQDTSVPTTYQQQLRAKIASPKVIEINRGHIDGIVEAGTVHGAEIIDFFHDRLK
jgi:dienelactone hydrolase